MGTVRIIKKGLRQEVSEQAFKNAYEKNGWEIDTSEQTPVNDEIQQTVLGLPCDNQRQNYLEMERRKQTIKTFNDGLFYE